LVCCINTNLATLLGALSIPAGVGPRYFLNAREDGSGYAFEKAHIDANSFASINIVSDNASFGPCLAAELLPMSQSQILNVYPTRDRFLVIFISPEKFSDKDLS
jgi:hypothetical protein